MSIIPQFQIYGLNDNAVEEKIQPVLKLRGWHELSQNDKKIALQQLIKNGWITQYSDEILSAIKHLNYKFLRECPGKHLHDTTPRRGFRGIGDDDSDLRQAALQDFEHIFLQETKSDELFYRMVTVFADGHIRKYYLTGLEQTEDKNRIKTNVDSAFETFDSLANCLNHIFEQFAVNMVLTRNGLVPRQDIKITQYIYEPTLKILSDPKWKTVSDDLTEMFADYNQQHYPGTITMAHRVVQRFLQIVVGEEGKNSKGELANLFRTAKEQGILPANRFTEPIINVFQSFISSERATKSTAKPAKEDADSEDALLIMNVIMIFIQFCLQRIK